MERRRSRYPRAARRAGPGRTLCGLFPPSAGRRLQRASALRRHRLASDSSGHRHGRLSSPHRLGTGRREQGRDTHDARGLTVREASITHDEQGATLLVGLAMLTATEPLIASNQLLSAQAQSLAEAGVERALWAVQRPQTDTGIPRTLSTPAPAPYDGSQLVPLSSGLANGGFRLTILPGTVSNERQVVSVGWMPTDDPADLRPKA